MRTTAPLNGKSQEKTVRRLIRLGGSVPGARRPPRRRSDPLRKACKGGA